MLSVQCSAKCHCTEYHSDKYHLDKLCPVKCHSPKCYSAKYYVAEVHVQLCSLFHKGLKHCSLLCYSSSYVRKTLLQ